jgi:tetratricopeptide (TPR) repeat protein
MMKTDCRIFATVILMTISLISCGKADNSVTVDHDQKVVMVGEEKRAASILGHMKKAEGFWVPYDKGTATMAEGDYEQALQFFEIALERADNRSAQYMALVGMAECYELLEDYELAANFYEAASKASMDNSPGRKKSLEKAVMMREKWQASIQGVGNSASPNLN